MTDPTPPDANCQHCGKQRGEHGGKVEACPGRSWASTFEPKVPDAKCSQELPKSGAWGVWAVVDYDADVVPAELNDMLALIPKLSPEQRAALGKALNPVREDILAARGLLQQELAASRRNEALRAQERDDAAERAAAAKERSEYWWTQYHDARRKLAEMTKRVEAAEEKLHGIETEGNGTGKWWDLYCQTERQLAQTQESLRIRTLSFKSAEDRCLSLGARCELLNEHLASVTAERDALRLGQKVVAERQREACAKAIERNWANPISKVRRTPLVMTTETEAGQQLPACPICGNAPTDHDPMADICYARAKGSVFPTVVQDPEMLPKLDDLSELMVLECDVPGYHRAKFSDLLAIIQRLTQEQRQALERVADEATKPFTFGEMLHTCSRLRAERDAADEGQKARIRELENLLKAITVERDAAVREGQARAITWAAKTMYDSAWSLQRGYHVKLSELADLVRSGSVTP